MAKNFNFGDSPVAQLADDIRTQKPKPITQTQEAPSEEPITQNPSPKTLKDPKTLKKPEVGITVQLPRRYYTMLRDIKDDTGTPLRDLALQAVIEYIDNYRKEE